MCDPFSDDCNSSPRYLIEVISQLFALTVKMRGLVAPVSTTILSPLCEAPKAARAEGESVAAANSALQRARATMQQHLPAKRAEWSTGKLGAEERALLEQILKEQAS